MTHLEHTPEVRKPRETVDATAVPHNTPDTKKSASEHLYTYPNPEEHYPSELNADIEKNPALYWERADF